MTKAMGRGGGRARARQEAARAEGGKVNDEPVDAHVEHISARREGGGQAEGRGLAEAAEGRQVHTRGTSFGNTAAVVDELYYSRNVALFFAIGKYLCPLTSPLTARRPAAMRWEAYGT
jgi:hypothetical protein